MAAMEDNSMDVKRWQFDLNPLEIFAPNDCDTLRQRIFQFFFFKQKGNLFRSLIQYNVASIVDLHW